MINRNNCHNHLEFIDPYYIENLSQNYSSNINHYQYSPKIKTQNYNLNQPPFNNENEIYTPNQENILYYDPEKMETPKMSVDFEQNEKSSKKYKSPDEIIKNPTFIITNISTKEETFNNKIIPKIQNIVSSADLSCNINLKEIALQVHRTSYNPAKFTGLIMRIKEPKTTALIFPNGKMVCLGAKNEEDSYKACKVYAKNIKKCNYPVNLQNFKIRNIVGSCNVKFQIPLLKLSIHIQKYLNNSSILKYEPEIFPGLIYRFLEKKNKNEKIEERPNIVFLIYASGNIVITGAKNKNQIYDAFKDVYPLLSQIK